MEYVSSRDKGLRVSAAQALRRAAAYSARRNFRRYLQMRCRRFWAWTTKAVPRTSWASF